MRFLVFSDAHIHNYKTFGGATINGLNRRATRCLQALDVLFDYAVDNKIDLLVFCGDWFVPRKEIDSVILNTAVAWINKLKSHNIDLIMVEGNHDKYSGDKDGIYVLKDLVNLRYSGVAYKSGDFEITNVISYDDCNFVVCPFFNTVDGLHEYIDNHMTDEYDKTKPIVLLAHTPVFHAKTPSGYKFPFGFVLDEEVRKYFTAGFFGDNHKYQNLTDDGTDFYSVGSALQHDFGDEGQERGFMDVIIENGDTKIKLVDSNLPKFFTINKADALEMSKDNFNYHRIICNSILSDDEKVKLESTFDNNFEIVFKYNDIFENDEMKPVETLAKKDLFEKYMSETCAEGIFKYKGLSLKEKRLTKIGLDLFGDTQ